MTKVVGYYNARRFDIQLVISKFNCALTLKPGEFVKDKQGRKINDPFFELYVASKQLQREVSDQPVPYVMVQVATAVTVTASQCDGQAVRVVREWRTDAKGHRQPVIPPPANLPPQPVNKPSVIPMSVAEARQRGFIGKVREVPEDYGAQDTDGSPPSNPPRIKYTIDSAMNKGVAPLPTELTKIEEGTAAPVERTSIVQSLASAATTDVESVSPFANSATTLMPSNVNLQPGAAPAEPIAHLAVPPPPEAELSPPVLEVPPAEEMMEAEALPEPKLALPKAPVTALPQPPRPTTARDRYVCAKCGKPFQFRSQLAKHAKETQDHLPMFDLIMAPYPLG